MSKSSKIFILIIVFLAFFLRIYKLGEFPPGLYSDEAALGYNAYSLLETGKDEFAKRWPVSLKSFGDYKPPLSAWLMIPSVYLFGLNEFSVRLPSAIIGSLTVLIVFFLAKEIFDKNKEVPYIASGILAVSPWHLLFTRSAMLVGVEVSLISAGFLFFLIATRKSIFLYLSSICFVFAIYTYYGSRMTVPLLVIALAFIFRKELIKLKVHILASFILGLILLTPLLLSIKSDPSTLTGRAKTVSIFYDQGINLKLTQAHAQDGQNFPTLLSRFFHNKPYFYFRDFTRRYLQHFSFDFLVVTGDVHPPFKIPNMGLIYVIDLPFFLYGLYLVIKKTTKKSMALVAYLLISPVAASFSFVTPSANRSFNLIIGLTIISAFGITGLINYFKNNFKLKPTYSYAALATIYVLLFSFFINQFFFNLGQLSPQTWHYGRSQLVDKISRFEASYDKVIFSEKEGPAYIWLLFYKEYSPQKYWQSATYNPVTDEYGFIHVKSFDKYTFVPDLDWTDIEKKPNVLYVGYEEKIPDLWTGKIGSKNYRLIIDDRVLYPNGTTAFKIAHLSEI